MPELVFLKDSHGAIHFPLSRQKVILGRGSDCEITLDGPQISRDHASIFYEGGFYRVEDHSKNGTFLNDKRVTRERLKDKDIITIGDWRLRFVDEEESATEQTVTRTATQASPLLKDAPFVGMIGQSAVIKNIFQQVQRVASTSENVLILGETGTGKELIATALHQRSKRALLPFVVVNCAAISPNLVESELFGHERGAFTGAVQTHQGAFEQAGAGTLFLDEIGELSLDLQSKLLRTLEVRQIRRVGGRQEINVKCRMIAATHRNLTQSVKEGKFREDLYYRLFVLPIEVPPLRQRREDIPVLTEFFLNQMRPGNPQKISEAALEKLNNHLWPGNIRELKNVILRAALLATNQIIEPEHLVFLPHSISEDREEPRTIEEMEKEMLLQKLKENNWNKAATARALGVANSTVFKKIKDLGLLKEEE